MKKLKMGPPKCRLLLIGTTVSVFLMLLCNVSVECYNLSPKPNVIISDPQFPTNMPKYEASYFGFTLLLRKLGIIIGAPRAQSTLELQRNINETGAIYRCTFQGTPQCNPYVFENRGNIDIEDSEYSYDSEKRDFQWLGAAMDGGTKDTDKLIVCAPRFMTPNVDDLLMHGRCYWVNDTLASTPKNVLTISPLRAKGDQVRFGERESYFYYSLAEQGLSVHVTPDNDQFLIGAPGIHKWKGSVIRYRKKQSNYEPSLSRRDTNSVSRVSRQTRALYETDIPNPANFHLTSESYFGYSVGSGYFDSNNPGKLMYVATAPQADEQSGEAYVFDYISKYRIGKHFVFRGIQFGEYFGYAVLAEDINGDGLSDVIISAPQYTVTGSYDEGAIYVFLNQGNYIFERTLIISPIQVKARFGTTLTKLGDINRDGFNDIAVSAPFAEDGSVFVYMGSERGLREQPSQRLDYPMKTVSPYGSAMFGHGLSKGADVDDNGYNDFAIGAPNAELVFMYYAYPVVSIKATISSHTREITREQTKFPVTVCYSITTNSPKVRTRDLAMNVVIDPQVKRVRIASTNSNEMQFNATASTQMQCRVLECQVIGFTERDIFKPIELELHYKLVHSITDSDVFCETCAAVDPAEPKVYTEKIIFSTGCAKEICVADLQLKSNFDRTFILGSSKAFTVSYDVTNKGETAYLPQINITSSNRMPFAKIPSNCKHNNQDSVLLCDLNQGQPMANGASDTITVIYDTSSISGEKMVLMAKVFSTGLELTSGDNIAGDVITLTEFTEIAAVGVPKTAHINLEEVSNTAEVINFYEIKSNGPSTVSAMQLVFDIPVAYTIPGTTKTIPIVDMNNITIHAMYDSQIKDVSFYQNNTHLLMNPVEKMSSFSTQFSTKLITEAGSTHFKTMEVQHGNEFTVKEESFGNSILASSVPHSRRRREAAALTANKEHYARIANAKSFELLGEDLKGTLPVNRTIVFNCNEPEMTLCVRAVIPLYDFKRNKPVTVTMKYHVDLQEVNQILIEPWEFFVIVVGVDVQKIGDPLGSTLAITKKIEYNIISKHQLYGTPIWVIILSIIGGLLALALITYGMYKAGFFKRAKKEEMDKLVHQAKLSNDGVTEASTLNAEHNE